MNMSIVEARELLRATPLATHDELLGLFIRKVAAAGYERNVSLLREALGAYAILAVDEGHLSQEAADWYVARISDCITAFVAQADQIDAEREEIERFRIQAEIDLAQAEADIAKWQAVIDQLQTARYARARRVAKWRMRHPLLGPLVMYILK